MAVTPPPSPQASTWSKVLSEIQTQINISGPIGIDQVRRQKIANVERLSTRPLIIYVTAWTTPKPVNPPMLQLDLSDITGFRDVTQGIQGPHLDVLLHSPGGSAEAAESIVELLRNRFSDIRFIIPVSAKSASTMLAMSGDNVVMDDTSELGPTDPQMLVGIGGTVRFAPADEILAQFDEAAQDYNKDPSRFPLWYPILSQMGPSLLAECKTAKQLSVTLVRDWLIRYMFRGDPQASTKADTLSTYLSTRTNFLSHGRGIRIPQLLPLGVKIFELRTNPALREAVWELWCSIDITLRNTPAVKMYENSMGHALVVTQTMQIGLPIQMPFPLPGGPPQPPVPQPPGPQPPGGPQPPSPQPPVPQQQPPAPPQPPTIPPPSSPPQRP